MDLSRARLGPDGFLDFDAAVVENAGELQSWIKNRLNGCDDHWRLDLAGGESPNNLFVRLWASVVEKKQLKVQQAITQAMNALLLDVVGHHDRPLSPQYARWLLLLCERLEGYRAEWQCVEALLSESHGFLARFPEGADLGGIGLRRLVLAQLHRLASGPEVRATLIRELRRPEYTIDAFNSLVALDNSIALHELPRHIDVILGSERADEAVEHLALSFLRLHSRWDVGPHSIWRELRGARLSSEARKLIEEVRDTLALQDPAWGALELSDDDSPYVGRSGWGTHFGERVAQ